MDEIHAGAYAPHDQLFALRIGRITSPAEGLISSASTKAMPNTIAITMKVAEYGAEGPAACSGPRRASTPPTRR